MTFKALPGLLLIIACADFERGPTEVIDEDAGVISSGDAGSGASSSFATEVEPLLNSSCKGCHQTGGAASGSGLLLSGDAAADLPKITALIDLSTPASSRLLTKAAGHTHGGGIVFAESSTEYRTLLAWVAGGANP